MYATALGGFASGFGVVEGTADMPIGPVAGALGDADGDGLADVGVGGFFFSDSVNAYTEADGLYVLPGAVLRGAVSLNDDWRYIAKERFNDFTLSDYDGDGLQDLLLGSYGFARLLAYDDILP